jgi:hypothetical protein
MEAIKTVGYWVAWLFWYGAACIPAALFGSTITAAFYSYQMIHKPHTGNYFSGMYLWEVIGGIVSAVPGFVWVGVCQLRDHRKEQVKLHENEAAEEDDASVWPPAPRG